MEQESVNVVKKAILTYQDYDFVVLTSTGKDSTVALHLTQKVLPNVKVMFNNTSLDCVDTYKIVKNHPEWIVTNPQEGFYQYIKRLNYIPTRFSRGCCSLFKEGASINYFKSHNIDKLVQVMGVRNSESAKRKDREDVTQNPKWTNKNWYGLLPIRKWSDLDIWLYILKNKLEINEKYKKGYSRVGCAVACPYYTKTTWFLDKYWFPLMYKRWHNILQNNFLDNQMWKQLNCTAKEYHTCWNGGLLRGKPTEDVVCEMMEYKGLKDKEIALKFFNKKCENDNKNLKDTDVLAMNMKLFGNHTEKFYCKKCLIKQFGWGKVEWDEQVRYFKSKGCELF